MMILSPISHLSNVEKKGDLASPELDGETIILDARSGQYYGLDREAGRVWSLIQESTTVLELFNRIASETNIEPEISQTGIIKLVQQLFDEGLIMLSTSSQEALEQQE